MAKVDINSMKIINGFPKVEIEGMELIENTYDDGRAVYSALKLIEHSKKYPVFDLPLAAINLSTVVWGEKMNMDHFIFQVNRMNKTDLQYPIILDNEGQICDGWHRICKAILEGRSSIKAVRLQTMPEPDRYIEQ